MYQTWHRLEKILRRYSIWSWEVLQMKRANNYSIRELGCSVALLLLAFIVVSASASTINISGSLMGTASIDPAGRCAPLPTINATATGSASGLGNFTDIQSQCTTSLLTFDQGIFDLVSTDTPGNSLFGIYSGTAVPVGSVLDFTATLLVTGGTGLFANDSGTLHSNGTLDENTAAFSASFSGSITDVPEPSAISLMATGVSVLWLTRRRANSKRNHVSTT